MLIKISITAQVIICLIHTSNLISNDEMSGKIYGVIGSLYLDALVSLFII